MARCRRAKRSCAYNFRDAKFAFPSLEHNAIVQAFRKRVPEIVSRVFEDVYSRATLTLRLCDGKWRVWRLGRGTQHRRQYRRRYLLCSIQRCSHCGVRNKTAQTASNNTVRRQIDPTLLTLVEDIAELTIDEKTARGGEEAGRGTAQLWETD